MAAQKKKIELNIGITIYDLFVCNNCTATTFIDFPHT